MIELWKIQPPLKKCNRKQIIEPPSGGCIPFAAVSLKKTFYDWMELSRKVQLENHYLQLKQIQNKLKELLLFKNGYIMWAKIMCKKSYKEKSP